MTAAGPLAPTPRGERPTRPCHDAGMADERFDLVVRGGTVVTPGRQEVADVGVSGGRIAQLGGAMTGAAELDARGLLVIPGGIDAHVHLVTPALAKAFPDEPIWVDDFWTGSLAAIAGGITTVANMTFALDGETMTEAVAREMAEAAAEAAVDWFLHPVLAGLGDGTAAEIAALAADGHASVKVFLSNPDFAAGTPGLADAIAAAGRAGALTLVHCEDAGMLAHAGHRADRVRTRRGAELPRGAPGQRRGRGGRAGDRPVPPDRRADLHRPPVLGRRPGPVPPGPRGRAAGLRRDQAAVPAPDQGAVRRAGRGQVRRRAAAAGPVGPGRAVARAGGGRHRHRLQRPRAVDAGRQARPRAQRGHRPAGRRRPGDADADAVLRGRRHRADHAGPVRGADLGQRRPPVRPLPAQGRDRGRVRRRPRAVGPR